MVHKIETASKSKKDVGFVITERDKKLLLEISRWKCPLGRHIERLAGFSGASATYRRLKKLIDAGYLERTYYLYGVPAIYSITPKAKGAVGLKYYKHKVRLDEISHDITVLDVAIYLHEISTIPYSAMVTERELHGFDGFSNRKHQPDFIYRYDGKVCCVEVELTPKSSARFEANLKSNFNGYDAQLWIVPEREYKVRRMIDKGIEMYPNIEVLLLENIKKYLDEKRGGAENAGTEPKG